MKDNLSEELRKEMEKYTVPVSNVINAKSEAERIRKELNKRIFGQDRPIRRIVRSINIFEAGLNNPLRPINCLTFAGPSGVGKTYTAKEFGHIWIGEPKEGLDPVVLIACGSLTLEHQITSLTGAPPSYVGYHDKPALESVGEYDKKYNSDPNKRPEELLDRAGAWLDGKMGQVPRPIWMKLIAKADNLCKNLAESSGPFRSVVIFDEFEKAHPNIQKELLNILEEGKLRLQNGKVVDFTGSLIILTTNIGTPEITEEYLESRTIGFRTSPGKGKTKGNIDTAIWRKVVKETEKRLPPELLSRIGGRKGIIVFHVLKDEDYLKILDQELTRIQDIFVKRPEEETSVSLSFTPEFKKFLLGKAESPKYGARILRNVVDKYVKEPLAQKIAGGKVRVADKLLFTIETFDQKIDEGRQKEGKVKILRQPRQKGKSFPLLKLEESEVPSSDIEKILEGYLRELTPPSQPPAQPGID